MSFKSGVNHITVCDFNWFCGLELVNSFEFKSWNKQTKDTDTGSIRTVGNTGEWQRVTHLSEGGADPYSNKHWIAIESFKDVALTMNLARINFIEECHQHERVEYDGEMLWGWRVHSGLFIATAVNVECHVTCSQANHVCRVMYDTGNVVSLSLLAYGAFNLSF